MTPSERITGYVNDARNEINIDSQLEWLESNIQGVLSTAINTKIEECARIAETTTVGMERAIGDRIAKAIRETKI